MEETLERALEHARRADDPRRQSDASIRLGFASLIGPLPIDLARPRLDELIESAAPSSAAKGFLLVSSSLLAAMAGDFDDARSRCREGKEILEALGRGVGAAAITTWSSAIELLAGDLGRRGARPSSCAGAAPGARRAREPRFDRRAAGRGAARSGSLRGGAHRHRHERGSIVARRCPRADFVAGRAREGARPARPRPGSARDRHDRRRARRHH